MAHTSIETVNFGKSQARVTRVGLGGEGILRTRGHEDSATAVIHAAVNAGIGYYDTARVYQDSEVYLGRYWSLNPGGREEIFHTSKSAARTCEGALAELDETLARLGTDYLDLWQIHDVRDEGDLEMISGKGGALEAFVRAREEGRVRHIGVTGHHDPRILTRAVESWPVDAVHLPVNPVEEILGGFLTHTLAAAGKKGIAVIAMKVLGAGHYIARDLGITPELLVQYALSFGVTTAIVGCSSPEEVAALAEAGRTPVPLSLDQRKEIMKPFGPMARKLAFYRGRV